MSIKHSPKLDPDYEISEVVREQIKLREETEKTHLIERVRAIVKNEFQNELSLRENQLELIQHRLNKAAKTLHLLRHCLVTTYYNRTECVVNEDELLSGMLTQQQNRIHPAIKKLLGQNSLDVYKVGAKRNRTKLKYFDTKTEKSVVKIDSKQETDTNSSESADVNDETVRNRSLTKHRIVVGNISKWMPSESNEDSSTHKWMVYVRGPKERPEVDHIIQKVTFYLHPSYKPNDVVELTESPFHLSRRGWGEFPLRVRLYFHCKLNKPVDIVHNLKLDRTYTGRQTLGNETVVELSLYDNGSLTSSLKENSSRPETPVTVGTVEHDYCVNGTDTDDPNTAVLCNVALDHSYCGTSPSKTNTAKAELKTFLQERKLANEVEPPPPQIDRTNRHKRPLQPILRTAKKPKLFDHSIASPINRLRTVRQALSFLLKRLPIVTDDGADSNYKTRYPYVAVSLEELRSWNIGKRSASEWSRAKTVRKILANSSGFASANLSTKNVVLFARAHGHTPLANYKVFDGLVDVSFETIANTSPIAEDHNKRCESDALINVVDSDLDNTKKSHLVTMIDNDYKAECSYIKQTALDVGVILKSEEIIPGVLMNGAERMMLEAVKCFIDGLVRNARSCLVRKGKFREMHSSVTTGDVVQALNERPEFCTILTSLSSSKDPMKY